MKKVLITNVAYGPIYADIFLNQHIKSLLDPTNIPAVRHRVEYIVFTDHETLPQIEAHDNWKKLKELIPVEVGIIGWPEQPVNRFDIRYNILMGCFQESLKRALSKDMLLSAIVADLVAAREYLPNSLKRIDSGYDSVFMQPPRCAADVVTTELNKYPRAMWAEDLWSLCYQAMHPLWVACHWEASQFTKLPFSLLWNSGKGLLVRSFSITPAIFTPYESMLTAGGVIDRLIPSLCKNPYWAEDWTEVPLVGVEPLFCYYPPFANHKATVEWTKGWAKQTLDHTQFQHVKKKLYYPSKEVACVPEDMEKRSDDIITEICG